MTGEADTMTEKSDIRPVGSMLRTSDCRALRESMVSTPDHTEMDAFDSATPSFCRANPRSPRGPRRRRATHKSDSSWSD
jgi:hypothetical protein